MDTRVKGLPEDVANAFLAVNALDEQVFQFGSELFDAQLSVAREARKAQRYGFTLKYRASAIRGSIPYAWRNGTGPPFASTTPYLRIAFPAIGLRLRCLAR